MVSGPCFVMMPTLRSPCDTFRGHLRVPHLGSTHNSAENTSQFDAVRSDHGEARPEQWTDTEIRIAIEFKWCNMSVVLADAQLPWIIGFKPLLNYQSTTTPRTDRNLAPRTCRPTDGTRSRESCGEHPTPFDSRWLTTDGLLDSIGRRSDVLVLPHSDDGPSFGHQRRIGSSIASNVRIELVSPPFAVGLRHGSMLGASMPEASIDHDDHPRRSKDDIGPNARDRLDTGIDAISHSSPMQLPAQRHLWRRISPSCVLHPQTYGVGTCSRSRSARVRRVLHESKDTSRDLCQSGRPGASADIAAA